MKRQIEGGDSVDGAVLTLRWTSAAYGVLVDCWCWLMRADAGFLLLATWNAWHHIYNLREHQKRQLLHELSVRIIFS